MFLNIHIDLIILKTLDQQFTLMTKKSLHIIFKGSQRNAIADIKRNFIPYWRCCI